MNTKPKTLVNRRKLSSIFNVHMQTIMNWEQSGMPVSEPGRRGVPSLYSVADVEKWLTDREEAARENGTLDLAQERARRERAQAIMAEQTVAIRARDLVPANEVEKVWTAGFMAIRAKVLSWPATVSDIIYRQAEINGLQGVQEAIKQAGDELLLELSKPKRVVKPRPTDKVARVKKRAKKARPAKKSKKGGRRKK